MPHNKITLNGILLSFVKIHVFGTVIAAAFRQILAHPDESGAERQ
jgi:hypothetical protein